MTDAPKITPIVAGRVCIGHLLNTARGIAAYGKHEQLLGVYGSVTEAALAVEQAAARSVDEATP